MESFIPTHLLKFIDPNQELQPYYERGRKKLNLKFNALEKEGRIASVQFSFAISQKIKYPILGADFVQCT